MNNLYFALLLTVGQFFGLTEPSTFPQKENQILKDSIPFVCGQADGYDDFLKQHPEVLKKQNQWEKERKIRLENGQTTAQRGTAYEIPVVVHIIHNNGAENISDADVAQGIQYLNEGFASSGIYAGVGGTDTEMTFRLAERDPDNNPTTGINRVVSGLTEMLKSQDLEVKNLIRWDPNCYVNFWLVREICKPGNCGVAGYAYLPSAHGMDVDGIVMEARHFSTPAGSVVQIHEVGHYLGLYHTFQDGCKNDDCLSDGDRVCDTPPDQSTARVNCADGANTCSTDVNLSDPNNPFSTDENDQMENFMDYASCSVLFTEGQKTRMVDALENVRFSLIDTDRCPVFCSSPVTANFSASATDIFAGETVTFADLSAGAATSTWTIDDVPFSGTSFTFNATGSFTVRLQIIGADPACRDKYSLEIRVKCPVKADFAISSTQVALNETVNFTNSSTGATSYEWTVNNSIESSVTDFNTSWTTPGIYTVCLTAENGICQSSKCQRILVTPNNDVPCTGPDCEDCNNGIDDNDDGLVDFFDDDCPCITSTDCGAPFYSPCQEICDETAPIDSISFDVDFTGHLLNGNGIINAADYTGDCELEVCSIIDYRTLGVVGRSGVEYTFTSSDFGLSSMTSADVDNDGAAEIFVLASDGSFGSMFIYRLDYNPVRDRLEKTWETSQPYDREGFREGFKHYTLGIADFNQDGRPEVYMGNHIFDSETGRFLASAGSGFNTGAVLFQGDPKGNLTTSVAMDLLPDSDCPDCSGLEIAAGNQVFSVAINSTTNPALNSVKVVRELPGYGDGATAIADFDLDGDLDIVVANLTGTSLPGKLYVWDAQTNTQIGQDIEYDFSDFAGISIPAIGDLDGDGRPEIVVNSNEITAFDDYQAGGGTAWGSDLGRAIIGVFDSPDHQVGIILFDFNLDGKQEVVLKDQWGLHILDENMNRIGYDREVVSLTQIVEAPLIIDWDNDQEAEILTIGCVGPIGIPQVCETRLVVINSASFPWANTRKIQNQYAYFNTNINDDGTVPIQQQSPHLLNDPAMNSFNQQYAMPNPDNCAEEICLNGIDDDGDGLVDFFDEDCPCITGTDCGSPFYSTCVQNCNTSESIDTIIMNRIQTNIGTYPFGMLLAGDIDGDCLPEICGKKDDITYLFTDGKSKIIEYSDSEMLYKFAIGDVDNDGMSEVFILMSNVTGQLFEDLFIIRLDYDPLLGTMEKTWESNTPISFKNSISGNSSLGNSTIYPLIADFNQDDRPEIYVGNQIFDSETGNELAAAGIGFNFGSPDFDPNTTITGTAVAADIIDENGCSDCQGLELVAGNQVFSVSINSYSNPSLNSIKLVSELPGFNDGITAIVDFDLDGDNDIVVTNFRENADKTKLYIWDGRTPNLIGHPIEFVFSNPNINTIIGVPSIGNIDKDSFPEIIYNNGDLIILEDFETGGKADWGKDELTTVKSRIYTEDHGLGTVLFDFNLDNQQEIVLRNQSGLKIFDNNLKLIGSDLKNFAATQSEYPLIVDIDNDDQAEIITYSCLNQSPLNVFTCNEIYIYESQNFQWANTRKILNQFAYFNTNINDDGTVPSQQQSPHLLNSPALNSFNQQYAIPAPLGAEAATKIEDARCGTNGIEIDFEICNDGEEPLPRETPVAIYNGNPTQINANLLLSFVLGIEVFPGDCILLTDTISGGGDSIFVVVNDDGSLPRPFILQTQFPPTDIRECDFLDNISGIEVPLGNPPALDLGPDILICDNGIFLLDAGAGFETYRWSDESFERSITVFEPGKYWVETTGICGTLQTDTIVIEIDPITEVKLGIDLTVCEGDTISFDAGLFDNYKWLPKSVVDCDTCQIFNLKISQDTQVIVQVQSDLGCISLDTIDIFVAAAPIGFDSVFICRGDTISVNGTAVFSDSLLSQKINSLIGCDSILNTKITVRDSVLKNRKIEICAGDTAFVFGNPITSDSILTQIFNGQNTCDSTERVEVIFKNRLFSDDELQFCEGDTAMIFGTTVTQTDTLSRIFTSTIGCDSTSEIRVVFTNSINSDDELDLCVGDTAIVFGNQITSDSTLFETYNSANGCDSIHEVRVKFRPAISGGEMLEYCEGDTVMILGNMVTKNDTISEILTAANGCDSLATVEIFFNQKSTSSDVLEFCEGDTAIIFGLEILKDSIVSQTLVGFNGCDSTSEIRVVFTNSIQTDEDLILCQGDTAMIFGNEITSDSTLSESFVSLNGCDSTHEVRAIFNQPVLTEDLLEFCEGDTAIIFGKTVTENDLLQEIYTAANGCDSTSKVELIFHKKSSLNEIQEFCEGDTARIFGLEIMTDSIVSQTLPNLNGCDSTHSIEVIFNQKFETFDQLEFCFGDTAFLFGNALTKDSTISEISTSAIGCDSTHNIDVIFLAEAEKMIFDSLCAGEYFLFFNDTISETGTYFQTISSIDACDTNYVLTAEFFEDPIVELVADTLVSLSTNFKIPLNISDPTLQVIWESNPKLSCQTCSNPTVLINENESFEVIITNAQGCSVVARINIRVTDENGIYVPTGFSPNRNGINDFFTVFSKNPKQIDQLQIFDRWGGLLFELTDFMSNNPTIGWDGKTRGLPVNSGVYVYKFLIKNEVGEVIMVAGDVTVFR